MKGIIVKYNTVRKFGFIRANKSGMDSVFFHIADVLSDSEKISEGAAVSFTVIKGEKGPKAQNIKVTASAEAPFNFYFGAAVFIGIASYLMLLNFFPRLTFLADYLVAVNVSAYTLLGFDKRVAGTGTMRVPEGVLFVLAIIGGTAGIFLGMKMFRHKIRKRNFQFFLVIILVIQFLIVKGIEVPLLQ